MKLKRSEIIEVDIESIKGRITQKDLYEKEEIEALLNIVNLFENGKFKEAIKAIKAMPDEWEAYIDEVIYDSLVDFQKGIMLEVIKD